MKARSGRVTTESAPDTPDRARLDTRQQTAKYHLIIQLNTRPAPMTGGLAGQASSSSLTRSPCIVPHKLLPLSVGLYPACRRHYLHGTHKQRPGLLFQRHSSRFANALIYTADREVEVSRELSSSVLASSRQLSRATRLRPSRTLTSRFCRPPTKTALSYSSMKLYLMRLFHD